MLQTFQSEWDSLMLETFNLKKQLDTVKKQLAHEFYRNDAAQRVIARLIKERDDARESLAKLKVGKSAPEEEMQVDNSQHLPSEVDTHITSLAKKFVFSYI
jgi:pre-mRNA-processing factor 19